jgi:hypothetical protein
MIKTGRGQVVRMTGDFSRIEFLLSRAMELRTKAESLHTPEARRHLLNIAEGYELLVQKLQKQIDRRD